MLRADWRVRVITGIIVVLSSALLIFLELPGVILYIIAFLIIILFICAIYERYLKNRVKYKYNKTKIFLSTFFSKYTLLYPMLVGVAVDYGSLWISSKHASFNGKIFSDIFSVLFYFVVLQATIVWVRSIFIRKPETKTDSELAHDIDGSVNRDKS